MTATPGEHTRWMDYALKLAARGEGLTRPNPPVGAVVVLRGRRVGAGYHRRAGGPHAEIFALRQAGRRARGSSLYVTLEPCCTWGRTPPCTDAIRQAGVQRVVVGARDPNPAHAGRGLTLLRRNGVKVSEGVRRAEAEVLIAPFRQWILTGRPFVTLKLAMSMDGQIADRNGRSRWITGPEARARVHALRRRADAILVGRNTIALDDPGLQPRPARGRKPYRVIVDSRGRTPLRARVLNDEHVARTIMATTDLCPSAVRARWSQQGALVLVLPRARQGVSLPRLMKQLGKIGITHVLCEGGGLLAASLVKTGQINEYAFFLAPSLLGGKGSIHSFSGPGWLMDRQPGMKILSAEMVGRDLLVRAKPATGTI